MKSIRLSITLCLLVATHCLALDSSDLLFHLSFEDGLKPELARGSAQPAKIPADLQRRLVEGLWGKGYLFGSNGSSFEFFTGDKGGPHACDESYSPLANFFGDSGTVSFWVKPLGNPITAFHYLFLCNGPGVFQMMQGGAGWTFHYAGGNSYFTDGQY